MATGCFGTAQLTSPKEQQFVGVRKSRNRFFTRWQPRFWGLIKENATTQQSQEEYNKKYNRLVKRYEKAVDQLNKATAERESRMQRDRDLRIFISSIKEQPLVLETWDEGLWLTLLETATVHADNRITFLFKDGTYIEVGAE